ncbi:MAG: conjugative coupling factor TraD, PFGI-1 class, partial [Pseudomonadota bacterium]|nr:conjugative coupling factor TraD, PFGI-1 class [Pseudomonadota bacterium]
MSRHPIEALLRPPVELWSMAVAFAAAAIAILAPWALMMPPGIAYAAGTVLVILGLVRGRQAWRVIRYQRNMRKLPTYQLRANQIPLSQRKLFLGKGFRWTQKHTQRLRDTLRPEVQHYIDPGPLHRWARQKEV